MGGTPQGVWWWLTLVGGCGTNQGVVGVIHCVARLLYPLLRMMEVESKYYADGEDAFAMRKDLTELAKKYKEEKSSDSLVKDWEGILAALEDTKEQ